MKLHRCGRKCVRSMSIKGLNGVLLCYCMKIHLTYELLFFFILLNRINFFLFLSICLLKCLSTGFVVSHFTS